MQFGMSNYRDRTKGVLRREERHVENLERGLGSGKARCVVSALVKNDSGKKK